MKYTAPEMNIVMFEAEEVIVASAVTTTSENLGGGDMETDGDI